MAEKERFSMREVIKQNMGDAEKSTKTAKTTKEAKTKAKSQDQGKYIVKIVDGVKYMILK